jgi:isopenicillin N synthase-like dioxygenase
LPIQPVSFDLHERDFARFADALGRSFERYGFAVVEGHRIDPALVARAERATRAFFALPDPVKSRYRLAGVAGQRGYVPFGVETAKGAAHPDLKEFWHVGREGPPRLANVWPEEIADFRPAVAALYGAFDELGAALLAGVAHHLGLPRDHFSEAVADGESILRLLHYPPTDGAGPAIRAGAHEDINAITLLLGAEEAGLELLDRDGRWLAVNPEPGAVVVNIGDMLQRLTNHRLPSTTHRVVNPAPERRGVGRYSMPFFLHFRPDYLIRTLEGCVGAETPDRYPEPITASAYLAERLREIRLA